MQSFRQENGCSASEFSKSVLNEYEKYLEEEFIAFLPCHSCMLPDGISRVDFGVVSLVDPNELLQEAGQVPMPVKEQAVSLFWDSEFNEIRYEFGEQKVSGKIASSHCFWRVKAVASPLNYKEEALWLINVTVSLMRIFWRNWSFTYPQRSDLERNPIIHDCNFGIDPLMVSENTLKMPGGQKWGTYELPKEALSEFQGQRFQRILAELLKAKDGSLAERLRDALGWMAKGRQEPDRALRLLFFFTAIEAMLSTKDKGAPVTDTIARHGSVIISVTKDGRFDNYKWIRKLYEKRSDTVHRGMRNSLWGHSSDAQEIAEVVAWQILEKCDLTQKFSEFHEALKKASFGSEWEPTLSTLAKPEHAHA